MSKRKSKERVTVQQKPGGGTAWVLIALLLLMGVGGAFAVFNYLGQEEPPPKKPEPKKVEIAVDWEKLKAKKARLLTVIPPLTDKEKMVHIPAGTFYMGAGRGEPFRDARPVHPVTLDEYWIDATEVTNAAFARFVKETGYVTVAEKKPDPKDFPNVPAEKLQPFSQVFKSPKSADVTMQSDVRYWWTAVYGACWFAPEGPDSTIENRWNHPVVHICYHDAVAYAKWAKKRLPTEAEWERAARGGLDQNPYAWGESLLIDDKWQCNIWQGNFPRDNDKLDGHYRTAPVGSFPANGFGLHDMAGNVWEWCADWYRPDYYKASPRNNPKGPKDSYDPNEPHLPKKVQRGGSFLCSKGFCTRYLPAGRGKGDLNSGASHIGFRCVSSTQPDQKEAR